jgi:ATP/maltotriose-dependent transcriptional regulator MalT
MSAMADLRRGRESFARREWSDAYAGLRNADAAEPLLPGDLEIYATSAYLTGRMVESADLWTRAHSAYLVSGNVPRAARCAIRLGIDLLNAGERVRGTGWVERAKRLLDDEQQDCVEQGYVLLPEAVRRIMEGDVTGASSVFAQAADFGRRFREADLLVMARHGMGRALMRAGRIREGIALLDEAMVALEAGEVSPIFAGEIYCSVIEASLEVFDARRAREWTTALAQWCQSQPDLVPYTGQCLVRRAEIMQLHGDWSEAIAIARNACDHFLRGPEHRAIASAFYQQAELQRLRGDYAAAEESYREASRRGRDPQPGMALMRLAQGQVEVTAAGIRRAADQATGRTARCRLLPAFIEIMLATNDTSAARSASDELTQLAESLDAPLLHAAALQARGAVSLAAGDAREALESLRRAWGLWQDVEAPYEGARVRVLIGLACRALGDEEAAEMEFDAARWVFEQLSAMPDVSRARSLSRRHARNDTPLTERERQVLRLIAAGRTNRAIAGALHISEKTVARHVSNIFTKLGLSSRSAATAYAYEHGLT